MNNFYATPREEDLLGDLQRTHHIKQITICHINILPIVKFLSCLSYVCSKQHIILAFLYA